MRQPDGVFYRSPDVVPSRGSKKSKKNYKKMCMSDVVNYKKLLINFRQYFSLHR